MAWSVCIVGKVSSAQRVLDERFEQGKRGPLTGRELSCYLLAKGIVQKQLEAAAAMGGDKYISITAAGDETPELTEIKMAIRLLPGFVE